MSVDSKIKQTVVKFGNSKINSKYVYFFFPCVTDDSRQQQDPSEFVSSLSLRIVNFPLGDDFDQVQVWSNLASEASSIVTFLFTGE